MLKYLKDRIQGKASKGQKRSWKWRKVRKAYLKEHPACEACGSTKKLEVHHIIPFSVAPELELDMMNLMALCENKKYGINCHLLLGHKGNYRKWNMLVSEDVRMIHLRIHGE